MKTAKTKIDVFSVTLSMEFYVNVVNFKIIDFEIPNDNLSINFLDTTKPLTNDCCAFCKHFMQEVFVDRKFSFGARKEMTEKR